MKLFTSDFKTFMFLPLVLCVFIVSIPQADAAVVAALKGATKSSFKSVSKVRLGIKPSAYRQKLRPKLKLRTYQYKVPYTQSSRYLSQKQQAFSKSWSNQAKVKLTYSENALRGLKPKAIMGSKVQTAKKLKLSGKNPPINQHRQILHKNGTPGKSQFKSTVDADNLTKDAWHTGTPRFNKNGKFIGKAKEYKQVIGTNGQKIVDTRFSRKHGIHGIPSNKKF